jgi:FKBP-type peptidyl-prolyl cis-trans isomerase FklB
MNTTKEKVSYCIGLETGKNLKQQFMDMDFKFLLDGFHDAINEANPKLQKDEIQSILTTLRQQIESQQKEFIGKLALENKKAGETFLEQNKTKPGIKTTASGLQYRIIETGTGATPSLLDVVTVHYKGTFIDGKVFDSSIARGTPNTFPVNRVIPGWSEVLQLMKVGDKWEVFIPSYLAYGEIGFGNDIPPNSVLVFEMQLIKIEGAPA